MRIRDVRSAAALCVLAILGACSKSTDAPVATTISVTPTSLNFASLNATTTLQATVQDQNGNTMTGAMVTWSTSSSTVATVASNGLVTAKGNGTGTVTATSGSITRDVAVTVAQVVNAVTTTGGGQLGTVGTALNFPISVHVTDANNQAVANAAVAFAAAVGSGSVANPTVNTNATGDAQTTWTLGTVSGAQNVTATAGTKTANFPATAVAGPASAITIQAGNNQTRVVGTAVPVAPSAKVTDSFGNVKPGVTVQFTVTAGGGSVTGGSQQTDAAGIATVGSWTMGGSAGTNTLTATIQGTATNVAFSATAVAAGAPANIAVLVGNNQSALVGFPTNIRPAVLITDNSAQPVSGVSVTFSVATGGGSVTNSTATTNAQGIAQVGSWTVGAVQGGNTLTSTAAPGGIANNPITFSATGATAAYDIVIQNIGPAFSAQVQTAFDQSVAKWQQVIYGDVPAQTANIAANTCFTTHPAINQQIDDVLILAKFDSIDGPGKVLGFAGPCFSRGIGSYTFVGVMVFDTADVAGLISSGRLNGVILHEMGHVLGVGTHWRNYGCLENETTDNNSQDTYFDCVNGRAAMDSLGGASYTGGNKVPVENCGMPSFTFPNCGAGSYNGHWREATFDTELMSPLAEAAGVLTPLSILTVTSLEDLGYTVNYAAAEPYAQVFTLQSALRAVAGLSTGVMYYDDRYRGNEYFTNPAGQIVRVVPFRP